MNTLDLKKYVELSKKNSLEKKVYSALQFDSIIKKQKTNTTRIKKLEVREKVKIVPEVEKNNPEVDDNKRLFLKVAGVAGLGLAATALFPKSAEAYVAGSTPTSNVVGSKDASNVRINPAKEDGNLATIAGKDFATQTTLAAMKVKTDLLTFDGSNNLLTASSGSASAVGIKDKDDVRITPATDDSILYLRRIVKLMESQAVVDSGNRQRITLDSLGTATAITTTVPVSGSLTTAGTVSTVSTVATVSTITTMLGQNHQAFQDVARNAFANGIRNNLNFT